MRDFCFISAKVLLPVYSVAPVRGFLPVSVIVLGDKLNLATEVFYNGLQATEFLASSQSRLLVRVPESQVGKAFHEIKVYSKTAISGDAELELSFGRPLKMVEGIQRLVQAFCLIFLTTPGSDLFDPTSGGGARALVGRNTDRRGKGVAADLALAIEKTKSEILRKQSGDARIPLSEKLLSASLDSLHFNSETATLTAVVSIQNMLGESAEVQVG